MKTQKNKIMNKYAVSDIHGCLKTFKALLKKINFTKEDQLYILGDYIDRGPHSKGVFDYILELQNEHFQIFCLRGNHDQMMLDAIHSMKWQRNWLQNGGWTTVESFDAKLFSDIPMQYFDFIKEMPYYIEVDNYILVHAGFSFDMPNPFDELHSMLWQRNWYDKINYHWLQDRMIIHGHTPTSKEDVKVMLSNFNKTQYLNIDTGCVYKGRMKGLGYLTCFDLGKKELIFQESLDS